MTTIYSGLFNGNPYNLINTVYPDKFKPWEIPKTPKNFWNVETGKQAVRWMIEDKLKWSEKDVKEKYCQKVFNQFKLEAMLNMVFACSPFKAINATYPGRFKEEDFNYAPKNYWTKEKAVIAIKNILDELNDEEIKKYVSAKFFVENGVRYPFQKFFSNRPFSVLDTIYPERFDKKDFIIRTK